MGPGRCAVIAIDHRRMAQLVAVRRLTALRACDCIDVPHFSARIGLWHLLPVGRYDLDASFMDGREVRLLALVGDDDSFVTSGDVHERIDLVDASPGMRRALAECA